MRKAISKAILVVCAVAALAVSAGSAFATGDQYVTNDTFGPGGGVTNPNIRHYSDNSMTAVAGVRWHIFVDYPCGCRTNQHKYFTTASDHVPALYPYDTNAQVGCYRTVDGTSGYRTGIYCVGTY